MDFLVVADHAEYLGVIPMVFSGDPRVADLEIAKRWKAFSDAGEPQRAFAEGLAHVNTNTPDTDLNSEPIRRTVWNEIIEAAEQGASSLEDLSQELNVATCCGRCASCAKKVLRDAHSRDEHAMTNMSAAFA